MSISAPIATGAARHALPLPFGGKVRLMTASTPAPVIRDARPGDAPVLWTLSTLPNIGETADPHLPLALPPADAASP